jgi:hypothetical protein
MTNLGPQFQTKDWNPFLAASNALNTATSYGDYYERALAQAIVHNKNVQNHVNSQQPAQPIQPEENKMTPYQQEAKSERREKSESTFNTTGITRKNKGAKPTAPGTKPKRP